MTEARVSVLTTLLVENAMVPNLDFSELLKEFKDVNIYFTLLLLKVMHVMFCIQAGSLFQVLDRTSER
jgi:hypothetical protein